MRQTFVAVLIAFGLAIGFRASADTTLHGLRRDAGESDLVFARRALHLDDDTALHVTAAAWNGLDTLFVDYSTAGDDPERPLVALQRAVDGSYRVVRITVGEQEGGTPDLSALGFAKAGGKTGEALIVILTWPVRHFDVDGTLYEVRIFHPPTPGQTAVTLAPASRKFGSGCDCAWRDGATKRYRFKTIAAVKAELRKLGY